MTIEELSNGGNTAVPKFRCLRCGKQTTLAFVQSGKGLTHRLLHRPRVFGDHRGFLPSAEGRFPGCLDYPPNRVPKRPNATVNKFPQRPLVGAPIVGAQPYFAIPGRLGLPKLAHQLPGARMNSVSFRPLYRGLKPASFSHESTVAVSRHSPTILIAAGAIWVTAIAAGLGLLHRYATTPGQLGICPQGWTVGGPVVADPTRANLVMLLHPRCPCSRASLAQLERIMAVCRPHLAANILFLEPRVPTLFWRDTELWRRAAAISGTRCIPDPGGVEAKRFGAMTSGHVLLYDRSGKLLFSGGITEARGHEGDNAGSDAIIGLVRGKPDRARTAVFRLPALRGKRQAGRGKGCMSTLSHITWRHSEAGSFRR